MLFTSSLAVCMRLEWVRQYVYTINHRKADTGACRACFRQEVKQLSEVCIGIDQSYEDTGISVCVDGSIKVMGHIYLGKLKNKTEKRNYLKE